MEPSSALNPCVKGSLLEILLKEGHINLDQKKILILEQKKTGKRIDQLMVDLSLLPALQMLHIYARYVGADIYQEKGYPIDKEVVFQFPSIEASQFQVLPISIENNCLYAIMVDPENVYALDRLYRRFSNCKEIKPLLVHEAQFAELMESAYQQQSASSQLTAQSNDIQQSFDVINFVEEMIERAVRERASDIHVEPEENMVNIRLRVDGILKPGSSLPRLQWSALCVRLKIMAGMNIAESRLPQDGRFTLKIGGRMVDFRVAIHPTLYGENIVIRILDKMHSLRKLEELGFNPAQVQTLVKFVKQAEGIVILTGPTGSGKTTTLYSLLKYICAQDLNIMTLEDPVEYEIQGIRQTEIKELGGVSFAEGIRSILRQDPDVIFVGEIRDPETAQMAVRAAMTGHLVLTTLHTNDCFGAIHRLLDFGLTPSLLVGNLLGIVSQRLVRKVCTLCHGNAPQQECSNCDNTGYRGRIAIGEILDIDEEMEAMIAEERPLTDLKKHARLKGFKELKVQAQHLVQQGLTKSEEIQRTVRGCAS